MPAALQAGYDDVRLPILPYPHSAVLSMHKERIAVLADASPELGREADSSGHRDFASRHHITRGQSWIGLACDIRSLEEDLNTLFGNLLY